MSIITGSPVTVTIGKQREVKPLMSIGEFVRLKRRRKQKDIFFMITGINENEPYTQSFTLKPPFPSKKKNGYTVDRLKGIYKHKPRKEYFTK